MDSSIPVAGFMPVRQFVRMTVRASLVAASAAAFASSAFAAEPQAAASEGLEEVVVTAQFREQNVQDTPLAITAISAGMLESRSQNNISEMTSQAPNVTLKQSSAMYGPAITASIRGVGQGDFNPAVEPGVGIYVDDVYFATMTGSMLDLLDLERVEVLRGPQGTLAGRNSIGGAIKLYSKVPQGDDTGTILATYGSRNRVDLRASGDFAITDTLFARVAGVSKKQDGYVDRIDYGCANPGNPYGIVSLRATTAGCVIDRDSNVNFSAIRGALRWLASDDLEFNLAADYTSDQRNPTGVVLLDYRTAGIQPQQWANLQPPKPAGTWQTATGAAFVVPKGSYYNYAGFYNSAGTFSGFPTAQGIISGAYNPAFNGTRLANYPLVESRTKPGQWFDGWGTSLTGDWKISDSLTLKSISAYREYDSGFVNDNDLSPLQSSIGDGSLPFHSFSQELRLNGAFGANAAWEYTLGGFYMDQRSTYKSWQDLRYTGNYPLQFQQNDVVNADTKAVFGHLGWHATDKLTLTAGVRYTEEHKDYTFVRLTRDGQVHPFLGVLNGLVSNYDGDNVDYRGAVQYSWTDDIMTYLQYSTGFKGGGISPRPFVPTQAQPFDPEELKSWEIGSKFDFFDRTLRVNAAVFHSKYSDIQFGLQQCPPPGPAAPCGQVANAGDATVQGLELEAVWRPFAGFQADASYSYIDFEYDSISPRVTSISLAMTAPFMPENKWSAGAQYEFSLGDWGTLTPRVDVSYQGKMYANAANTNAFSLTSNLIESYTLANARVTWKDGDNKWESSLELTNLTDEWYLMSRADQYTGAGHTDGAPGRPREWALTVKRKF
ncbi:MAG: TonB-dependent receptor [Steroidobacteraceae bacterium]